MTELPYSLDVLYAVQADFNRDWWPVVLAAFAVSAAATAAVWRGQSRALGAHGSRLIAASLGVAALATGGLHQWGTMAAYDFMAPVYGAMWLAEGGALLVLGLAAGRIDFGALGAISRIGTGLAVFGIVLYPLLVLASGAPDWRSLPFAGSAPNPTAIVAAGLLLTTRGWVPLALMIVPAAWGIVAAVSGWLLDDPSGYTAGAAIFIALGAALVDRIQSR